MAACKIRNMDIIVLLCFLVISGVQVYGLSYDYSFTSECLESPLKPLYGGGLIQNGEMNGVKGDANNQSLSHKFFMKKGTYYTISAWLKISDGESHVSAMFKTSKDNTEHVGSTIARSGCWSMLKGGFVAQTSGPAQLYFNSHESTSELWADSISVQPFTEEEWRSHQIESIEKTRKSKVRFQAVDSKGQPLAFTNISVKARRPDFPFGCAISDLILKSQAYRVWFFKRFKYTVFENQMKWILTESSQGQEDYSVPDAMMRIMQRNRVQVRGHNILWDEQDRNPSWVIPLTGVQLKQAADKRVNSIVNRYRGQVIHWDVVNENMHTSFLETALNDPAASAEYYTMTNRIDNKPLPFLNEYFTIEDRTDQKATPAQYVSKINQMRAQGYKGPLGIGLQGHFKTGWDLAYIRSGLDTLTAQNLPIWITELTVEGGDVAQQLDQITRELHSHPSVKGILLWSAITQSGCFSMCLTDTNFNNNPAGNVIDKILDEIHHEGLMGVTDANGFFNASIYHGEYDFHFSHPDAVDSSIVQGFTVAPTTFKDRKTVKVVLPTV